MDVLPNPATRVPLIALPNDPASSYINANFVRSYDGTPNRFICTQGPLPDTVVAFWRMVLEHGGLHRHGNGALREGGKEVRSVLPPHAKHPSPHLWGPGRGVSSPHPRPGV